MTDEKLTVENFKKAEEKERYLLEDYGYKALSIERLRYREMKIFDLLNEYTSDKGSWYIEYNDHNLTYSEPDEYYISHNDSDVLEGINTGQDIYRLYWFNDTPVGHYCILANSIKELEEKIINVIKDDNLIKYKTKETIKKNLQKQEEDL